MRSQSTACDGMALGHLSRNTGGGVKRGREGDRRRCHDHEGSAMSATADWRLAEAIEDAMRPAVQEVAAELIRAAIVGDELSAANLDVLIDASHQLEEMTGECWERLRVAVRGRPGDIEDARFAVERMTEVSGIILDRLSQEIEIEIEEEE